MNSKEALKLLETRCIFFVRDNNEVQETDEAREQIEKDLVRLEKLEKAIDILKEVLNKNYIFKFGENIPNGGYISITKIDCNITTIVNIRKEEYDLLKEVLENE